MSTEPTGLGKEEVSYFKIPTQYLNFTVSTEDWCGYEGTCLSSEILFRNTQICLLCKYRRELDIPEMLRKYKEERHGSN